ncbi:MAG: membrane dipeptidase [Candidatus Paceibacterota bacterium]
MTKGHGNAVDFIDLHQDIAGAFSEPELAAQTDFTQLTQGRTKCVIATGFTLPEESMPKVIERDLAYYAAQCGLDPSWKMVKTRAELSSVLLDPSSRGIIFHIEGFPDVVDWPTLERWHERGWRSAGLVWNGNNPLGGGTNSESGLTGLGRQFIEWCEERRILIDLAHANKTMFADCLAICKRPPFISHGGLQTIVQNIRNYSGSQLREVADRDGILGIFVSKSAMAPDGVFTCERVVAHITAAIGIMGEDAVAIGSDFGGTMSGTPSDMRSVSHIGNLWDSLRISGYSIATIEKIALRNAERYLRDNLA